MNKIICIIVVATLALASQSPGSAPDPIERVLRDYETAWKANDPGALAELFTEDGVVLPDGQLPVTGREAIREFYQSCGGDLVLSIMRYEISGDFACILGYYAYGKAGPSMGKFTLILKKTDGVWKILSDMDNQNKRTTIPNQQPE